MASTSGVYIAPPVRIAWDRAAAADSRPASARPARARPPWPIVAAMLAVYFLWGSTYLAIRVALESFPPFALGAARFLVAGGGFYVVLRLRGAPRPTAAEWRTSFLTGALLFGAGNGFVALGEQWVSSGLVALLVGTMPLWAAVFGRAAGQPPTRREWLGLGLGFTGVAVLQLGGELAAAGAGLVFVLLAPMCWALGGVLGRSRPLPAGPMAAATQMLAGGVTMAVVAAALGESFTAVPSARALLAVLHLIVSGSLIGFTAYNFLLRRTRPAVANSYAYVNPVVAIVLGATMAGETVNPITWAATAVILSGVIVIGLGGKR